LYLRRPEDNVHARLRQCVIAHFFYGLRGYCDPQLDSCSREHFGFRHDTFNRHGFGDCGPSNLCLCQHKAYGVSTGGYDYYS
jgi:hypothetical protein